MLWHFILESLGYFVAFRLFLWERRKEGDFLESGMRWSIVAAALAGGAIGSRALYWIEDPGRTAHHWSDLGYLVAGKTIVGALLGGTAVVEVVKRITGIRERTGDLFAIPLAVGIAIGRLGCFLAGTDDGTYGIATQLPWGIDLGDGVRRHPVQLYESVAMLALVLALWRIKPPNFEPGDRFRIFLLSYFGWRLVVDFLKPAVHFGGLGTLQWACVVALLVYTGDLWRLFNSHVFTKDALANV